MASGEGYSAGAGHGRRGACGMSGMTMGRVEGSATSDELNEGSQPRSPFALSCFLFFYNSAG